MSIVRVPLTQGKTAIIDAEDWPLVSNYKWSVARRGSACYAQTWRGSRSTGDFRILLMHRVILDAPPHLQVDHRDRDGLNNRRSNLRLATPSQNLVNRGAQPKNKTGFKGVYWDPRVKKYAARLNFQGRYYYLGQYETAEDAARAYDVKARALHGAFVRPNFPD